MVELVIMRHALLCLALLGAIVLAWFYNLRAFAGWYGATRVWGDLLEASRIEEESTARQDILTRAHREIRLARQLDPTNPYLDYLEGLAYVIDDAPGEATRLFRTFAAHHPRDMGLFLRGWLDYAGDPSNSPFSDEELRLTPLAPHTAMLAAWITLHRNDLPATRQLLLRARNSAPNVSIDYHLIAGYADAIDGRLDGAFGHLRQAHTLAASRNELPSSGLTLDPFSATLILHADGVRLGRGPWRGILLPQGRPIPSRRVELLYNLAVLNHVHGRYARSVLLTEIVREHHADEIDIERFIDLERLEYPLAHRHFVFNNARTYDVDPWLVFAVMREESKFRSHTRSQAGATGLMQIMPDTGRWICGRKGIRWRDDMLLEPEINIRLACWFLNYLHGKFADPATRMEWVLASYNAGLGNAERWLRRWQARGRPRPVHEHIPFRETSQYIQRVTASYEAYQRIYGDSDS